MVIQQERRSRYFVSWHGRLLLLAVEIMRPVSAEEAAMTLDHRRRESRATQGKERKEFVDLEPKRQHGSANTFNIYLNNKDARRAACRILTYPSTNS